MNKQVVKKYVEESPKRIEIQNKEKSTSEKLERCLKPSERVHRKNKKAARNKQKEYIRRMRKLLETSRKSTPEV